MCHWHAASDTMHALRALCAKGLTVWAWPLSGSPAAHSAWLALCPLRRSVHMRPHSGCHAREQGCAVGRHTAAAPLSGMGAAGQQRCGAS